MMLLVQFFLPFAIMTAVMTLSHHFWGTPVGDEPTSATVWFNLSVSIALVGASIVLGLGVLVVLTIAGTAAGHDAANLLVLPAMVRRARLANHLRASRATSRE